VKPAVKLTLPKPAMATSAMGEVSVASALNAQTAASAGARVPNVRRVQRCSRWRPTALHWPTPCRCPKAACRRPKTANVMADAVAAEAAVTAAKAEATRATR
jgi:hypothetical protein